MAFDFAASSEKYPYWMAALPPCILAMPTFVQLARPSPLGCPPCMSFKEPVMSGLDYGKQPKRVRLNGFGVSIASR